MTFFKDFTRLDERKSRNILIYPLDPATLPEYSSDVVEIDSSYWPRKKSRSLGLTFLPD